MAKSFLNMAGYPLGLRNNNPGNLRPGDNWQGMIGENAGFVVFENIAWGIRALAIDLRTKIRNGYNTVEKIITRYAPPTENNTFAYIKSVSQDTGFTTETLTADYQTLHKLIRAIMNVELGVNYSALVTNADIDEGLSMTGDKGLLGPIGFAFSTVLLMFVLYLLATMPKR